MKIHHRLETRADRPPLALAIGFFDGVHLGHRALLERLQMLRPPGGALAVLTFSNHPATFLRPSDAPLLLTTLEERVNLLARAGAEELYLLPFDAAIAEMSPAVFLDVICDRLRAQAVAVGETFRFGARREGDVALAAEGLARRGRQFVAGPNIQDGGERISSTRIRTALAGGRLEETDRLLGAAYALRGLVTLGAGRGHDLGFPTANLSVDPRKALPPDGVYTTIARHDGRDLPALLSLGTNPTFGEGDRTVEVWIADFDETIYGDELTLRDLRLLRGQQRFDSVGDLIAQMRIDARALSARGAAFS